MGTYAIFYDNELEEKFEAEEDEAKARFMMILDREKDDPLYNNIGLYELKKIDGYEYPEVKDETKD
jgi:hypothetical protein